MPVEDRELANLTANRRWLEFAFWAAGANWLMWRDDFEYVGDPACMPILMIESRFLAFVAEYALFQRQTIDARLKAMRALNRSDLRAVFADPSGKAVDHLVIALKEAGETKYAEQSLISKIAAFAVPHDFNALDGNAVKGVPEWSIRKKELLAGPYQKYLNKISTILNGPLGQEISAYLSDHQPPTSNIPGFKRRMLDVYLMAQGGRWATNLSDA